MDDIENHYGQPHHNADAYCSSGNVFDGPDLFIMAGFYESQMASMAVLNSSAIKINPVERRIISESSHCLYMSAGKRIIRESTSL